MSCILQHLTRNTNTSQKMKFSIKDSFIFCAVQITEKLEWVKISLYYLINLQGRLFFSEKISRVEHCMKSGHIRTYSGPYFPSFGLNTERYGVSLPIRMRENTHQNNSEYGHFLRGGSSLDSGRSLTFKILGWTFSPMWPLINFCKVHYWTL